MERPAKRVRQACDPCRRKKSRCPGEKPVCSYCARLGQACSYTNESGLSGGDDHSMNHSPQRSFNGTTSTAVSSHHDAVSDTSTRLNAVENQLAEVLSMLNRQAQNHIYLTPDRSGSLARQRPKDMALDNIFEDLPSQLMENAAELYVAFCHCQPLPLFSSKGFASQFMSRERELALAVAALSLRHDESLLGDERSTLVQHLANTANALVMQQVGTGTIELSTLQTLCLLVLIDFYDSNAHRASINLSLAVDLSQSSGLSWSCTSSSDNPLYEEQMRCFWSIVLLVRMHANLLGAFSFSIDTGGLVVYPTSTPRPPFADGVPSDRADIARNIAEDRDLGIMTYVIQLSEVWQKVAQYGRRRRQPETYPPWSSKSEYAKILAKQMERETLVPYSRHRYKPANFAERTSDELNLHRDYWGPWLLNQMMYHGIICLLNHPLVLSLQLRNFRVTVISEIWLQHTDDLITSHTKWVVHLIELAEAKGFEIADPFLAHIAAIVATIYLQQSFVDDTEVHQSKRDGYSTCFKFVRQIGQKWHHIQELSKKLESFEEIVTASYRNSASSNTRDKVYIDLTTFWEILESSLISEDRDRNGIKFGSSLMPRYHAVVNAEEVNAHPLPEPSRLQTVSTPSGLSSRKTPGNNNQVGTNIAQSDPINLANDDFAVLAQSYFAQGQDFVGGLDDWWTSSQI